MSNTLAEIIEQTYYFLSEQSDSTTYDKDLYVVPKINAVIKQICKGWYKDITNGQIYKGGDMIFLRKRVAFQVKEYLPTTADIAVGDITISIDDTTNYLTATVLLPKYLLIDGDIIKYTGTTPTSFTGVTGIQAPHLSGRTVYQLFELSTDYRKPFLVDAYNDSGLMQPDVPFHDFRDPQTAIWSYSMIGDSTKELLWFRAPSSNSGTRWFNYYSIPTDLVLDSETCILPENYGIEVVAPLCAGELLWQTEIDEQSARTLGLGYSKLQMMWQVYAETQKNMRQTVKFKQTQVLISNPSIR